MLKEVAEAWKLETMTAGKIGYVQAMWSVISDRRDILEF